ncbi:hypothetical protein J2T18_000068 [Paenibacillus polymyxa]|uniref:hypothetical protein n=1 Tax=Paenibacillus polymyxa TaxID=1406 RepID=UPI002790EF17|nr:hypothetical protein [Paenibacillus polymyxa]MDQ0045796.1 hypothetical protein [Paenibacillus polymyxa]
MTIIAVHEEHLCLSNEKLIEKQSLLLVGNQIKIEALGGKNIGRRKSPLMATFSIVMDSE